MTNNPNTRVTITFNANGNVVENNQFLNLSSEQRHQARDFANDIVGTQSTMIDALVNGNAFLTTPLLVIDPVILDLNGDGVKLTSYNNSEVTFDIDNDGKLERTGWAILHKTMIKFFIIVTSLVMLLLIPLKSYATTNEEAEINALKYTLELQGINTPYHQKLWNEMKWLRKEMSDPNYKGEKNLIKFLIQKYNLDPINKAGDQCQLMERMVGYFTGPSGMSSSVQRECVQDGQWCFQTYFLNSNYTENYDDHGPDFVFVSDVYGRYVGAWSSFGKPISRKNGYFKITQNGDQKDPYLEGVIIPEATNTMNYISYSKDKPRDNVSYFKIDNCYIKEIHLRLDTVYIDPSYSKNSNN